MLTISLSNEILSACPGLHVLALSAEVKNAQPNADMWEQIDRLAEEVRANSKIEEVNKWTPIRATRQAYKALGKDPNRYRPSSEALHRRIHRQLPLYRIDVLVDLINWVSIRSGYSIGGFDQDKIVGDLILGVGREGERYEGIGRGLLNIEGLPVYRDEIGGVGTPTSDEERTKIDIDTTKLLMIINGYSGPDGLEDTGRFAANLLRTYALAEHLEAVYLTADGSRNIHL